VLHDRDGRITGFQEKPEPDEALSDLGNCGIYMFEPSIFDYFPDRPFVDWAKDVFPALLEKRRALSHPRGARVTGTMSVRLAELRQGTFDALEGKLRLEMQGTEVRPGVTVAGSSPLRDDTEVDGSVWIGSDVQIGSGVRLMGTDRARRRRCVSATARSCARAFSSRGPRSLPKSILIGAIAGPRRHPPEPAPSERLNAKGPAPNEPLPGK